MSPTDNGPATLTRSTGSERPQREGRLLTAVATFVDAWEEAPRDRDRLEVAYAELWDAGCEHLGQPTRVDLARIHSQHAARLSALDAEDQRLQRRHERAMRSLLWRAAFTGVLVIAALGAIGSGYVNVAIALFCVAGVVQWVSHE